MTVRVWLDYFFASNKPEEFKVGLARAGERQWGDAEVKLIDGWFSPTYGVKEPSLSFSMTAATKLFGGFVSEFIFPDEN